MLDLFLKDESGVTSIEYGLIAGLILVAIIGSIGLIGPQLVTPFDNVNTGITNALAGR